MKIVLVAVCSSVIASSGCAAAVSPGSALDAAKALVGTYTGKSTNYRIDGQGGIQPTSWFTETIKAENPVQQDGKAFVSATDEMTFSNGGTGTYHWQEGFYVNPDGSAGKHYFVYQIPNVPPQETIEIPLAEIGAVTFDNDVQDYELKELGFADKEVTFKKHSTVKNTVTVGSLETDVITRFTTISWKDAAGAIQTRQFVSRNGTQSRTIGAK